MLQTMLIKLGLSLFKLLPLKQNFLCHKRGQVVAGFGLLILNDLQKERTMNLSRSNDGMTDDSTLKKVFFGAFRHSARCTVRLLYIIYIYCHKCHKCHWPVRTGLSSVTVSNCFLSSVTTFPILGTTDRRSLSSVLSHHLATL